MGPALAVEIHLDGVGKRFVEQRSGARGAALEGITFTIHRGEIVVVVGPSGCGKSTLLRIVAGLETADSGSVSIGGRAMAGVPPQDRDVAMVFQGYALYPHMTAREILEFPLKMRGVAKPARTRAVDEAAALLRIEGLLDRRPAQMSGGERQRVAMGRALVRKPRVFLFDEPLSNLDASLRSDLRLEIGQLVRRLGATALYVTHDHVEAMTLADRIAVLRSGSLLQIGSPRVIYSEPATSFVGTFLGTPRMNLGPGRAVDGAIAWGPFRFQQKRGELPARIDVGVRPEHVHVMAIEDARESGERGLAGERGEVVAVEPLGAETHLVVRMDGDLALRAIVPASATFARGDAVRVAIDADRAMLFERDEAGGARLV